MLVEDPVCAGILDDCCSEAEIPTLAGILDELVTRNPQLATFNPIDSKRLLGYIPV